MHYSRNEENIAISRFESMLKTNDILFFDSEEFENIIHHYLENGKISLAKRAIKLGLEQHPTSINLQLFKVEILVIENKFNEADSILEQLHFLEPNNEEIYIQKANIFSKQDLHQKAINTLLSAIDLTENLDESSDLFALIGMEYLFLDNYKEALFYFKKCLSLDNSDYSSLHNIMYCYEILELTEEAIIFLNNFLNKNPYCEVAWHQLGKQYVEIKDLEKANAAFDYAIISDDTFVGAYIEKGKVLEQLKQYEEAILNYKITLALEDPTSFALLRIGYCYEKLENDEMAITFYKRTVLEDGLLDKGWIAITKFYMRKRNYVKAQQYINKAVHIDSQNISYWKLYATIHERINNLEEAEIGYKNALELGNYELDTWLNRADVLTKLEEYEAALYSLQQANEFYPDNVEISYRIAGLNLTMLKTEEGVTYLNKAIQKDPEFSFIITELFPQLNKRPKINAIISKATDNNQ